MPTTLTLESEKTKVKKAVPTSKILTAAVVRLYVASPDPRQWTYGLWGAATLLKDMKQSNAYFIRIIDIEKEEGEIVWEQELYAGFQFHQDAPFFYTFDTDDYLAGLEFADQEEGEVFYRKLHRRGTGGSSIKSEKSSGSASRFLRSSLHRKSKVTKDLIGTPEDFTHVSHVGYERDKGFNLHGENSGLVKELQALGISESEIEQNQGFIQEYLQQHSSRRSSASSASKTKAGGRRPPPPPPPRRINMPSINASSQMNPPQFPHQPPPPPPPPPSSSHPIHAPPPLPARHSQQNSPSIGTPQPPQPPPPPPPTNDGRSNLMESIRATGGFGSLKQGNHLRVTTGNDRASSPIESVTPSPDAGLVSSLADVLNQRKMAMGSDDENEGEDDDDDWD